MRLKTLIFLFSAALLVFAAPSVLRAQGAPAQAAGLEPLEIVTATGRHAFSVEVMRTEAEREKGLMFRRFMPADRGMLFDFKTEQTVMMWMKNTYLPLDMIFTSRNGTVTHIRAARLFRAGGECRHGGAHRGQGRRPGPASALPSLRTSRRTLANAGGLC